MMDNLAWAERVNRWIVHGGLDLRAAEWMCSLGRHDPDRLELACELARAMIAARPPEMDPKPWFYGGLFAVANADEARTFLASHPFTLGILPVTRHDASVKRWEQQLTAHSQSLVGRLRQELDLLSEPRQRAHPKSAKSAKQSRTC